MPIRKRKPTSPGRRFQTVSDFSEVTRDKPERSLTKPKPRTGGRNAYGRMTAAPRWRSQAEYRVVDFRRDKDGVREGRRHRVRPEPQRAHRAAALSRRREALHHRPAQGVRSGPAAERSGLRDPGRQLAAVAVHPGRDAVHNVELNPGAGGQLGRGAGASIQLVAKEGCSRRSACPSGEMRPRADRLPRHRRIGRQRRGPAHVDRQGGPPPRGRARAPRPRRRHEPGRPPSRRRRGRELRRGRHPVSPWGEARRVAPARRASRPISSSSAVAQGRGSSRRRPAPMPRSLKKGPFVDRAPCEEVRTV